MPKQLRFCRNYVEIMPSVAEGVKLGIQECQHQFRGRRWNCTTVDDSLAIFGPVLDKGTCPAPPHVSSRGLGQPVGEGRLARGAQMQGPWCASSSLPREVDSSPGDKRPGENPRKERRWGCGLAQGREDGGRAGCWLAAAEEQINL